MRVISTLPLVLAMMLLGERAALAQVGYSGSAFVMTSRSDTGEQIQAWYLVNSIDVAKGPIRATAMLPLVAQELTWTDPSVSATEVVRHAGVGDPVFRVDVDLTGRRRVAVQVGVAVKPPMRSADSGLGSGHTDVALAVTLSGAVGRNTWLLDVTQWILGDSPDLPLRNTPSLYAGYGRVLDDGYRWSLIVAASSSSPVVAGLPSSTQLNVTALRLVRSRAGVGATLGIGLTDGAPDLSVGASWRLGF